MNRFYMICRKRDIYIGREYQYNQNPKVEEWSRWCEKWDRKQCKWKNMSRQVWQDICTANFNYEHWPLSLSSFLLSLTNQLVQRRREGLERQMAKKKPQNLDTTMTWYSKTEQMDTATETEADTKTKTSSSRICICPLSLSFHFLLLSFLCSPSPLLHFFFHFKLECWDPNPYVWW